MPSPIAYLSFPGTCAAAMHFYEAALNAKIKLLLPVSRTPLADKVPQDSAHLIMHAELALKDGGILNACDNFTQRPYEGIKGVHVLLNYESVSDAEKHFAALAEYGDITMKLEKTFWAQISGTLVDRFGTPWIINGGGLPS